jgi:hypothetical protein
MSTGNDTGGEDRRNEPPLATVWRLHVGDEEDSSADTEEWYENERLSGHITGGAPRVITTPDGSAPAQEDAPAVLDWRYEPATSPPTVPHRLGQALSRRFGRRRAPQSFNRAPVADPGHEIEISETVEPHEPRQAGVGWVKEHARTGASPAVSPRRRVGQRALAVFALGLAAAAVIAALNIFSGDNTPPTHTVAAARSASQRPSAATGPLAPVVIAHVAATVTTTVGADVKAAEKAKALAASRATSRKQAKARARARAAARTREARARKQHRAAARARAVREASSATPAVAVSTAPTQPTYSPSALSTGSSTGSSDSPSSSTPARTGGSSSSSSLPAGPTGIGSTGSNCNPKCS